MKSRVLHVVLLFVTLCQAVPCGAAPRPQKAFPETLVGLTRDAAEKNLVRKGYRCEEMRIYPAGNGKPVPHLTFLECSPKRRGEPVVILELSDDNRAVKSAETRKPTK